MTLHLAKLGAAVHIVADSDGLWFRAVPRAQTNLSDRATWPLDALEAAFGHLCAIEIEQLLEQGLAESVGADVRIAYAGFPQTANLGLQTTTRWTAWSPFLLSVSPVGDLGRRDFAYRYRFFLGAEEVSIRRTGYYVVRAAHPSTYHLDDQTFALIDAMDSFNSLEPEQKTERENWLTFSLVKGCAREVGAALDQYLQSNEVAVPSRLALHIHEHEDGSISFTPRCPGVPDAEFREAFFALPDAEGLYSVDLPSSQRMRVVLDDEQREVLGRMKRVRHLTGEEKSRAIREPAQYFDGLLDRVDLPYGRRVEGVGEFSFVPVARQFYTRSGIFDGIDRPVPGIGDSAATVTSDPDAERPSCLQCVSYETGEPVRIDLANAAARSQLQRKVRDALARGHDFVEYDGYRVRVDQPLADVLLHPPRGVRPDEGPVAIPSGHMYLLIYTDEEVLKPWDQAAVEAIAAPVAGHHDYSPPNALRDDVVLKGHQIVGVTWLQACDRLRDRGRRGSLLADDMGLGKTLQVLVYLAWCIERGHLSVPGSNPDAAPWRPILIIYPSNAGRGPDVAA